MESIRYLFSESLGEETVTEEQTVEEVSSCLLSESVECDWTEIGSAAAAYVVLAGALLFGLNHCVRLYHERLAGAEAENDESEEEDDVIDDPDWQQNQTDELDGTIQELLSLRGKFAPRSALPAVPALSAAKSSEQQVKVPKKRGRPRKSKSESPVAGSPERAPQPSAAKQTRGRTGRK